MNSSERDWRTPGNPDEPLADRLWAMRQNDAAHLEANDQALYTEGEWRTVFEAVRALDAEREQYRAAWRDAEARCVVVVTREQWDAAGFRPYRNDAGTIHAPCRAAGSLIEVGVSIPAAWLEPAEEEGTETEEAGAVATKPEEEPVAKVADGTWEPMDFGSFMRRRFDGAIDHISAPVETGGRWTAYISEKALMPDGSRRRHMGAGRSPKRALAEATRKADSADRARAGEGETDGQ